MVNVLIKSLPLKERLLLSNQTSIVHYSAEEGEFIKNWKNHEILKKNSIWEKRSSLYKQLTNVDSTFLKENQENYKLNNKLKEKETFLSEIISYSENKRKWKNYSQYIEELNYGDNIDSGFGLMLMPVIAMYETEIQKIVSKCCDNCNQLSTQTIVNIVVRDFNYQLKQQLSPSLIIELNRCKKEELLPHDSSKDNFIFCFNQEKGMINQNGLQ